MMPGARYIPAGGVRLSRKLAMASIHTTLRRMVPNEVECKTLDGQKLYRLKTVEHWGASMLEDVRGWLDQNSAKSKQNIAGVVVAKRPNKAGARRRSNR
jgi:hypothetical protein